MNIHTYRREKEKRAKGECFEKNVCVRAIRINV